MTKLGYELTVTALPDGKIVSELEFHHNDFHNQVLRQVLDTQDEMTKKALIELGWTPPGETK